MSIISFQIASSMFIHVTSVYKLTSQDITGF